VPLLVLGILTSFLFYKYFKYNDSIKYSNILKFKIQYVRCQIVSKGTRSLIKVSNKNRIYNVPVTKSECKNLKVGDSIELLYSLDNDKVFYNKKVLIEKGN